MKSIKAFLVILVLIASSLQADIIRVPLDQSSIQAGINAALGGDTVLVAENTYYENINFKGKAITVASEFIMDGDTSHISKTIIDGSQPSNPDSGSVVYFDSGTDSTSILCGFTIAGGTGTDYSIIDPVDGQILTGVVGGGIFVHLSGGKICHNIITENHIEGFKSIGGGGIHGWFIAENKTLIIEKNVVSSNTVVAKNNSGAGGIFIWAHDWGDVFIRNNQIVKNSVIVTGAWKAQGGGIWCDFPLPTKGKVTVSNNIIVQNEVHCENSFGGGMTITHWKMDDPNPSDHDPNPLIYNNIIADNYSEDRGGGIEVWTAYNGSFPSDWDVSSQPAIINNTIVNNHARTGSGLFLYRSNALIMNSIVWNDLSNPGSTEIDYSDVGHTWGSNFESVSIYNSIVRDGNWNDLSNKVFATDPLFDDTLYHLSDNSPAVGLGRGSITIDEANYKAPLYDLNGNIRPNPVDTLIDIGAYESSYPANKFVNPKSFENVEEKTYLNPGSDYLKVRSEIDNPDNHSVNVFARIASVDESVKDSVELFDDGDHDDGEADDQVFGGELGPVDGENEFKLSLGIKDNDNGTYNIFNDNQRVTTIGPITVESLNLRPLFGTVYALDLPLRNLGQTTTARNITVELATTDTINVISIVPNNKDAIDIPPGQVVEIEQSHNISFSPNSSADILFTVKILGNGQSFWTDVVTNIEIEDHAIPLTYSLSQNYPNPFNPVTLINYQLPITNYVELSIYNLLGQRVVNIVNEKQNAGSHQVEWDATNMASGVYLFRIKVGNEFTDTKKLLLLK